MRFLHLADVHLDTAFASRTPAVRERLREASRDALRRGFDLAVGEAVHAVLLAGDLFDGDRLSFETERFLLREFRRLGEAGIAVVYATGNHDPGRAGHRAHLRDWPDNVTVVRDGTPRRIAVPGRDGEPVGWVTAAGHAGPRETADLSKAFPSPASLLPEVALLHTQVRGSRAEGEHEPYAPSELDHLVRSGFHYWALGHVHTRQALSERPAVHYPGNPQGRTPAEAGPRGGLMVDLTFPDDPRVDFRVLGPVRWETVVVEGLADVTGIEGLVGAVRGRWDEDRAGDRHGAQDWMVRVVLRGPSPLWRELASVEDRETLQEELGAALGALEVELRSEGVHPPVDVEEHVDRTDVLGETLRLLRSTRAGEVSLPGVTADELARAEDDPELDVEAYVAELLEAAEGEVLARLLDLEGRPPPGGGGG